MESVKLEKKIINQYQIKKVANDVYEQFLKSNKKKIVIINIGTDRCIGDCIGPYVGTLLKQTKLKHIKYYGSVDNPIHAKNIKYIIPFLKTLHKNDFIIGIDASLSENKNDLHHVFLRDIPISPGKGVGKNLGEVGDISIVAITDLKYDMFHFGNNVRFKHVMKMSNIITKTLKEVDNLIEKGM